MEKQNQKNEAIEIALLNGEKAVIDRHSSVLVLNEYQKQWTERSLYHTLINGQLKKRNVMNNAINLIRHWRNEKLPIIHAPIIQDPNNKKGFLSHISNAGFFTKDTWKSEFADGTFAVGDIVLNGRYTFSVFKGSNFDQVLKSMNVKTFLICGFTSSLCIKKTVDEAKDKGYNFIIIDDCSATFNGWLQNIFERQYADHITLSHEIIGKLATINRVL